MICAEECGVGECVIRQMFVLPALTELKCSKIALIFAVLGTQIKCSQVFNVLHNKEEIYYPER
jgi:hypothetical protein